MTQHMGPLFQPRANSPELLGTTGQQKGERPEESPTQRAFFFSLLGDQIIRVWGICGKTVRVSDNSGTVAIPSATRRMHTSRRHHTGPRQPASAKSVAQHLCRSFAPLWAVTIMSATPQCNLFLHVRRRSCNSWSITTPKG